MLCYFLVRDVGISIGTGGTSVMFDNSEVWDLLCFVGMTRRMVVFRRLAVWFSLYK